MVSTNQSAFIAGRCIHDKFLLVQQTAQLLHNLKVPRMLLKLDIARAFDCVSWPFLLQILQHLGFVTRWREWISILLSTVSTRVLINGHPGPPIGHAHGLRQGDPLSPMLFTLVIDVLNSMLLRAVDLGLLQRLTTRHASSSISLYADDVVIFCHPDCHDIATVRELLRAFGVASGLRTNFGKCSATPIHCTDDQIATIAFEMHCPVAQFPITYLALPLFIRKASTSSLLPLVDKLGRKLSTWRASMLSKGDRLALVRQVLCAILTHSLIAVAFNQSILKRVNRIIHGFLWAGSKEANGGQCLVNWQRVCRPILLTGLGVRDLQRAGIALRVRWLWLQRTDPSRSWNNLHIPHDPDVSAIFRASTTWNLNCGGTCKFWTDHWIEGRSAAELTPLIFTLVPRRRRKIRTAQEGLHLCSWVQDIQGALGPAAMVQYIELWRQLRHINFSDAPDTLSWRWTTSATYSASSYYQALFVGACEDPHWKLTWRPWAPLRIKFFLWLAMQDRCWTADRLACHDLPHDTTCALCDQDPKTMHHLLAGCSFSRQVWHEILGWVRATVDLPDADTAFQSWWTASCNHAPASTHKGLSSLIILTTWWLWKHHNGCIFNGDRPSISSICATIKDEARLWAKAGANGLKNILPET